MAEYILDDIDLPSFFEALFAKHRFYETFIPPFARTEETAARYLLSEATGLSLRDHNGLSLWKDRITLRLSSSLDRHDIVKLMAMTIIHKGQRHSFYSLDVEASHGHHDLGDRGESTASWIEIEFRVAE